MRFARGDRIELARHDAWWGGRPPWDRVTLRVLPADPARTAALLAGDVDAIEHVPSADLARLRASPALRLAQAVSWRTILLHLDQSRDAPPGVSGKDGRPPVSNPFKDVRVRRALSMAVNRQALAERVMEGLALPAGTVVSPSVFAPDPQLQPPAYDPDRARRLGSWRNNFYFWLSMATINCISTNSPFCISSAITDKFPSKDEKKCEINY